MLYFKVEPLKLKLKTPFRISQTIIDATDNVVVYLGDGLGESSPVPKFDGISQEIAIAYLKGLKIDEILGNDAFYIEDILNRLPPGPSSAQCAIDIALHDHWGKQLGYPLYKLWGLNPMRIPPSSISISLTEDMKELQHQIRLVDNYPVLKLKLGTGNLDVDENIVRTAVEQTNSKSKICVDVNGAWSVDEAAYIIPKLSTYDLLYIEQPIHWRNIEDWHHLRRMLPKNIPPLIADESVKQIEDILSLANAADGINIKLSKVGGFQKARRMILLAQAIGMKTLMGCMIESSIGITAAVHLSPMVDFVDLDGNTVLAEDPFEGAKIKNGSFMLPKGPGLGIINT